MPPRRRARPVRLLVLLGLLLLLALLLELNRFLPGAWPGGGGDHGLRPAPAGSVPSADRVRASDVPPPPPPPPGAAALVVVAPRRASAAPSTLTVRAGGRARTTPMAEDRAEFPGGGESVEEFRVERDGRRLVHGPPPPGLGSSVRVLWPSAALPDVPASAPGSREVRVEDGEGRPLAGAEVTWTSAGRETQVRTDASGVARIERPGATQVRVRAVADGHAEVSTYGSVLAPGPLVLRLPKFVRRTTVFVDEGTGEALRPRTLRLVTEGGPTQTLARPDEGFDGFETSQPADLLERTSLEVETPGRPTIRVPLGSLAERTAVPVGRSIAVRVTRPDGAPASGVTVTARYAPGPDPEAGDEGPLEATVRADAEGRATLGVPAGRPADLLVTAEDAAPAGVVVRPGEPPEATVALQRGVALSVRVRDAEGGPVARARVVVVARAGPGEVSREARTDGDGRATLPPVSAGRVEVLAHAPGRAWAAATVVAREGAPPVDLVLAPGRRLHLVVEDPWGAPIEGVQVRAVPRPGAGGQAPDAGDPAGLDWRTDAHGVLDVPDQPDRSLDLHLHRAGWEPEVLVDVRPGDTTWYATLVPSAK